MPGCGLRNRLLYGPRGPDRFRRRGDRLGFVRMGSYSFFQQTAPGGNFGVGGETSKVAPGIPGLTIHNFSNQDQYSSDALIGPASAFTDMGYYQNRLNRSEERRVGNACRSR